MSKGVAPTPRRRKAARFAGISGLYWVALIAAIVAAAAGYYLSLSNTPPHEPLPEAPPRDGTRRKRATQKSHKSPDDRARTREASSLPSDCVDTDGSCAAWAEAGECEVNAPFMLLRCNASCGVCDGSRPAPAPKRLPSSLVGKCRDSNPNCASWAGAGECEANAGFMRASCPLSCNSCPDGEGDPKCARDNKTAAVSAGDISAMFTSVIADYPQYKPTVLSTDPWVLTLDDFIAESESARRAAASGGRLPLGP